MLNWACQAFATVDDVLAGAVGCPMDENIDPIQDWIDMASDIIYHVTGGRVHGVCTTTVRPVAEEGCWPHRSRDFDYLSWGVFPRSPYETTVRLRGPNPVVTQVKIEGVVLPSSSYAMLDGEYLLRTDGLCWPRRNDLRKRDTELGTWSIMYRFGVEPDLITRQATVELVGELAKPDGIGNKVGFGPGVLSANVQGVTLALADRITELAEGRENLPYIARLLGVYAPEGRVATAVYSPDTASPWRMHTVTYA